MKTCTKSKYKAENSKMKVVPLYVENKIEYSRVPNRRGGVIIPGGGGGGGKSEI